MYAIRSYYVDYLESIYPALRTPLSLARVSVTKSNDSFLLVVGFYSKDGAMSNQKISDLLVSKFQDPISRINGVGSVRVFGGQNAMRVWLDPSKLYIV